MAAQPTLTPLQVARLTLDLYGEEETRKALKDMGLTDAEVRGIIRHASNAPD